MQTRDSLYLSSTALQLVVWLVSCLWLAAGEVWWASQDSVSSGEDDPQRVGGMLAEAVVASWRRRGLHFLFIFQVLKVSQSTLTKVPLLSFSAFFLN